MSHHYLGINLGEYFWLYEQKGRLLALAHLPPIMPGEVALIVDPKFRDALELILLNECQQHYQGIQGENALLSISVAESDEQRKVALTRLGFRFKGCNGTACQRALACPFPNATLPEGFSLRSAAGEHETALLANVHNAAF